MQTVPRLVFSLVNNIFACRSVSSHTRYCSLVYNALALERLSGILRHTHSRAHPVLVRL